MASTRSSELTVHIDKLTESQTGKINSDQLTLIILIYITLHQNDKLHCSELVPVVKINSDITLIRTLECLLTDFFGLSMHFSWNPEDLPLVNHPLQNTLHMDGIKPVIGGGYWAYLLSRNQLFPDHLRALWEHAQ